MFTITFHRTTSYAINLEVLVTRQREVNSRRDSLVGRVNGRSIIDTFIKPQLSSVFVRFHSLLFAFFLKLMVRSCKSVHILGVLVEIHRDGFTKSQYSHPEFQEYISMFSKHCLTCI